MLLRNVSAIILSPPAISDVELRIEGGRISEQGPRLRPHRGEEVIDLRGKYVLPGFVNAHTHLYSSLARGMPGPRERPGNFREILQKIWWKLDRALDDEAIYYSALVGAIDAVRYGTTTLVDHHASPKAINGSLEIIKGALSEIGLRGVLCYEVTDRGGTKERDKGLDENERFISMNRTNAQFRGLVGAHASFTLGDDSLRLCGELASEQKTGVHIHAAEDMCDVADAREEHGRGIIERLSQFGILKSESILAHCVHLTPLDFSKLHHAQCWLVHNPRSNMNNNVGRAPIELFGNRSALGTDGFPADMLEESRIAFFRHQEKCDELQTLSSRKEKTSPVSLLRGGQRMISEYFGRKFGTLQEGSAADLIVIDYQPPAPMEKTNVASHLLSGPSMVESVMVEGSWVMRNREVAGVDIRDIYEKSAKVAKKLWKRMEKL